MNIDLPGFDLNYDGTVDFSEGFLSYKAFIDTQDGDSEENEEDDALGDDE